MNIRAIVLVAAAILAAVLLAAGSALVLLRTWGGQRPVPPPAAAGLPGSGPMTLRSAPQQDLAAYRREQQRRLHGYGWVDAQRGIVHIPIDKAMELMAQEAAR